MKYHRRGSVPGVSVRTNERSDEADADREAAVLRDRLARLEGIVPPVPSLARLIGEAATAPSMRQPRLRTSLGSLNGLALAVVVVGTALVLSQQVGGVPTSGTNPSPPSAVTASAPRATPADTTGSSGYTTVASSHVLESSWAPDSQHFAITARAALPALAQTVQHILDRKGHEVGTVTADVLEWTGPSSFVLTRLDSSGGTSQSVGQLGSAVQKSVAVGSVPGLSSYPLGCVTSALAGTYTLRVGGVVSKPLAGVPQVCSADGQRVAVLQVTSEGASDAGWLQIVDTSTGKSVLDLRNAPFVDQEWAGFGPGDRALGFSDGSAIYVADLGSGKVIRVLAPARTDPLITPAWMPDGRLAVPDPGRLTVRAFATDGSESTVSLPYATTLSISSSGTALAVDSLSQLITMQSLGGGRTTLDLASCTPNGRGAVSWAPDGTSAVVICTNLQPGTDGNYEETAILILGP
jgi:hypothetical protein